MSDLPPLDQTQAHVVVGPNDQRGPYTMELLISEVLAGRLSEATPVWWPGLADWTTMGAHPGVAGELARRRAAASGAAGPGSGWTDPASNAVPPQPLGQSAYAQPSAAELQQSPQAESQPSAEPTFAAPQSADPFAVPGAEPSPDQPQPQPQPQQGYRQAGEIIDVGADDVAEVDPEHVQVFAELRRRSAARAEIQSAVDAVNQQLAEAVAQGVTRQGFAIAERIDTDHSAELRFDGDQGSLVVVSLGHASAVRPQDLRSDHVPITLSYRSSGTGTVANEGSGEHGDVVITADEWTGQSTSSVSLFLGLEHYLDDALAIDSEAVSRDIASTVAVVRSRLS